MKLGEAHLERSNLERQLEVLKSRLNDDNQAGLDVRHLVEEVQRKATLLRDMSIAIDWTEQHTQVSGLPLGAYRRRLEMLHILAQIVEPANRERADIYRDSAHTDSKFIENALWLVDLKVPRIEERTKPAEEDK